MNKTQEALKMAIEVLEYLIRKGEPELVETLLACKEALAELQDSETAIGVVSFSNHSRYVGYHTIKVLPDGNYHVYTSPPKRESAKKEKTELQAQINELREALSVTHECLMARGGDDEYLLRIVDIALAKTAPKGT